MLVAASVTVIVAILASVLVLVPRPKSALALVQDARQRFRSIPSLEAVLERVVSTKQLEPELHRKAPSWVQTTQIDFRDDHHARITVVKDVHDPFSGDQTGAFTVYNPQFSGLYDPVARTFTVGPASEAPGGARNTALLWLSPEFSGGPKLTEQAIKTGCTVMQDTIVAGRPVHHISCTISPIPQEGLYPGARAQVYLDAETGAVLKMAFPNGGGFEVKSIRYRPSFAPGTFDVAAPAGATVVWGGQGPPPPRFRVKGVSPEVTAVVRVGNRPTDVVAGEGAVWATTGSGWVTGIDPDTLHTTHVLAPTQTVVSPEGFDCARCKLVRRLKNGLQVWRVAQPGNIAAGGGSAWMTLSRNALQRIDPVTGQLVDALHRIHLPVEHHRCEGVPPGVSSCYQLTGPMVFADGSLWMLSWQGGGWFLGGNACCNSAVLRIDPQTEAIVEVIPIAGTAYGIVADEGAIWVSGTTQPASRADYGHAVLWRIDEGANRVGAAVSCEDPKTETGCFALAAGEGSIWFTNRDDRPGHGIVGRVDPATDRVVARIHACRGPNGIAVGGGFVWVACTTSNRVAKIDPSRTRWWS